MLPSKMNRYPIQDQLGKILATSSQRGRAIISLMAFGGVRPQVIGNFDKSDGLRIRDLPDLVIDGRSVKVMKTPAMITVRPELNKISRKYFMWLSDEGCEYLLGIYTIESHKGRYQNQTQH